VRRDEEPLGDLAVGRALRHQPHDRQLGAGQLRPLRGRRLLTPACPLCAAVAEQAADAGRVPFRAGGGLQPERLIQIADRLVPRPLREQSARILKRGRTH